MSSKKITEVVAAASLKNDAQLPLRMMFHDEARFGKITDPRACWAPAPHRPVVDLALVREFRYKYAAVSPGGGWNYFAKRVFDSLDAATKQAERGPAQMAGNKKSTRKLTNWPWISAILKG